MGGYLYAREDTSDNILTNFPLSDSAILLGRMGFCFTLLFGLPMVTLPCREALRAIPAQIRDWKIDVSLTQQFQKVDTMRRTGAHLVINGVDFDEKVPLLITQNQQMQHGTMLTYGPQSTEHVIGIHNSHELLISPHDCLVGESKDSSTADETDPSLLSQQPLSDACEASDQFHFQRHECCCCCCSLQERLIHFGLTFSIVGICYVAAISVPGVSFVWSICGSSMAVMIAFIIPTACYLKIRTHKRMNPRALTSWVLLVVSCVASVVCTKQALTQQ